MDLTELTRDHLQNEFLRINSLDFLIADLKAMDEELIRRKEKRGN